LDEFVAATGYARTYAIRLLAHPTILPPAGSTRPRTRQYGPEVQEALVVPWRATKGIGSKRLIPFFPELDPVLERHGHLALSNEARTHPLSLSPATADRLLQPFRQQDGLRRITITNPGALLKQQVAIRTFADWDDTLPGFLEADLDAHCGHGTEGAFLHTLALSAGAAVAVALATERPPAALILRSPFTSLVEVGRPHYPSLPVGLLLRDRYPAIEQIGCVAAPLLVVAGEQDGIVPPARSRRLYEEAAGWKRFVPIPGADHNDPELLIVD
jgi:pimeloyl-ACP methyl ester carboxylesterase